VNVFKLNLQCQIAKKRLAQTAWKYGLNNPKTIKQSQMVDKLVSQLQRRIAR